MGCKKCVVDGFHVGGLCKFLTRFERSFPYVSCYLALELNCSLTVIQKVQQCHMQSLLHETEERFDDFDRSETRWHDLRDKLRAVQFIE